VGARLVQRHDPTESLRRDLISDVNLCVGDVSDFNLRLGAHHEIAVLALSKSGHADQRGAETAGEDQQFGGESC